jgi:pheromone shutdown protein TraB
MITLLGVGHVFDIGGRVKEVIRDRMPNVVCIELDDYRYYALTHKEEVKGWEPPLHMLLAAFQRRIAKMYKVEVGSEMIAAVDAAKEVGARVAFIDMESDLVFKRIMEEMTFEEKVKFAVSLFLGFFVRKKDVERELERFQMDSSTDLMSTFGKEFPSIKRVLIDERNQYMAAIIRELGKTHERIVVVIGDGHVKGIQALIKDNFKDQVEVIRLKEVRENTWKRLNIQTNVGTKGAEHLPPDSMARVSFSFDTWII